MKIKNQQLEIIDVRSPSEYKKGSIPGAFNIPLFDDSQRALVGTCYKKEGAQKAIALGLEILDINLIIKEIESHSAMLVYCARGGMRSQSMCQLMRILGKKAEQMQGGYKAFRASVRECFSTPFNFHVITGKTGVGKTEKIWQLKKDGKQVIDLECIANHRGSAFGKTEKESPSQENFENALFFALRDFDVEKPIWIESESRSIGPCTIPESLYQRMKKSPHYLIEASIEERVERLLKMYGAAPKEALLASLKKLEKRLGVDRMRDRIKELENNDLKKFARELLKYYDQKYERRS